MYSKSNPSLKTKSQVCPLVLYTGPPSSKHRNLTTSLVTMATISVLLHSCALLLWSVVSLSYARHYYNRYPMTSGRMQYTRQESDVFSMDILMPGVIPKRPEEYLCYAETAPLRDSYIVKFDPKASMKTIHHMLVYGCKDVDEDPGSVVECHGSPCKGQGSIMFGWARDAPSPTIPKGVGFHVGGSSGINYIMIQLHYGDKLDHLKGTSGDHSGIALQMTHIPQQYIGGIYLLWSGAITIPPHSTNVHADMACEYDESANIHPFAFRAHAHGLGKVITGYLIRNGEWTVIAKGDPQWPQAFYPIQESYTIQPGDILAARCTYDSDKDTTTYAGATHSDEMCNLYLMYYTDATRGEAYQECGRPAPSQFFRSAPSGYNTRPAHRPAVQPPPRSRPQPVNPWDQYYDTYDTDPAAYYEGNSYPVPGGSNNDYNSPIGGGGGMPDHGGGETYNPGDQVTDKPKTGDLVTSGQTSGGDGAATPAAPAQQPEKTQGTTRATPAKKMKKPLTVSDVDGWPSSEGGMTLGQVSGVAVDSQGNVHVFHRASRPWGLESFDGDHFRQGKRGPNPNNTVVQYDANSGKVTGQWGANLFYLPHGLSIDHQDNFWLTDVAMHQVFKFPPGGGDKPLLTLGKKLEPGDDRAHFCKPSDVTVDPKTGNFFVSDGYCNARIVKFSPTGEFIKEWGQQVQVSALNPPVGHFDIPHSITMVTDRDQVCVADREVGRIQCFLAETGEFVKQFNLPEFGGRLYAVTYTSVNGGILYAVNGPSYENKPVRGFALNFTSGEILLTWKPRHEEFQKPHDLVCTPDGKVVYVAEIGPNKVWKFITNAVPDLPVTVQAPRENTIQIVSSGNSSTLSSDNNWDSLSGNSSGLTVRENGLAGDESMGTTTIIVAVLAVPILLMLLVAVAIRMHAQGHFRFNKKKRRNYKVTPNDKFSLGSLLHKRNGFSQVATDDSDHDHGQWSEESDVEEYSILNNNRTQNL